MGVRAQHPGHSSPCPCFAPQPHQLSSSSHSPNLPTHPAVLQSLSGFFPVVESLSTKTFCFLQNPYSRFLIFFVFPQQPTHSPMNLHRFQPSATGDLRCWLSPLALALCAWSRSDVALFFLLPLETSPNPFAVETRGWWHSDPPSVSTRLPPLLLSPLLPPGDVPVRSRDPCNP